VFIHIAAIENNLIFNSTIYARQTTN
jgi:hypothetical protein